MQESEEEREPINVAEALVMRSFCLFYRQIMGLELEELDTKFEELLNQSNKSYLNLIYVAFLAGFHHGFEITESYNILDLTAIELVELLVKNPVTRPYIGESVARFVEFDAEFNESFNRFIQSDSLETEINENHKIIELKFLNEIMNRFLCEQKEEFALYDERSLMAVVAENVFETEYGDIHVSYKLYNSGEEDVIYHSKVLFNLETDSNYVLPFYELLNYLSVNQLPFALSFSKEGSYLKAQQMIRFQPFDILKNNPIQIWDTFINNVYVTVLPTLSLVATGKMSLEEAIAIFTNQEE